MSYSMNSDQNRSNSETPSPISMENQLVYKIASLEATISNSLRRLDEKFDRMQTELHDRHIETSQQMGSLRASIDSRFAIKRARLDQMDKDMVRLELEIDKRIDTEIEKANTHAASERAAICKRIDTLEKWQTIVVTRASVVLGTVVVGWAIFGNALQTFIQRTFGG